MKLFKQQTHLKVLECERAQKIRMGRQRLGFVFWLDFQNAFLQEFTHIKMATFYDVYKTITTMKNGLLTNKVTA